MNVVAKRKFRQYDTTMIKFSTATGSDPRALFRLVHISDPHLSNLKHVSLGQLTNKRILGYLSWRFSRRHIHRPEILESLIRNLDDVNAHHLVISGDLTHIGTAPECEQVASWLQSLGAANDISVIPGNHDRYIQDDPSQTTGLWSAYMSGDAQTGNDDAFPSFRQRGALAIIGLSTALPTAPFFASGRLGNEQLDKFAHLLEKTKKHGLCRVVVLHHGPLVDSNKFGKRLIDAPQFRSIIKNHGAELILHGHGHYPVNGWLEGVNTNIPVVGAPSASLLSSSHTKRAGYNIYEVITTDEGWKIQMRSYSYNVDSADFVLQKEQEFKLPPAGG